MPCAGETPLVTDRLGDVTRRAKVHAPDISIVGNKESGREDREVYEKGAFY